MRTVKVIFVITFIVFIISWITDGYNLYIESLRKKTDKSVMTNLLWFYIYSWAFNHGKSFPNDLGDLYNEDYLPEGQLYVGYKSGAASPKNAKDIREGKCSFLYFGKGKKLIQISKNDKLYTDKLVPILSTKPGLYSNGDLLVLFSDGTVVCEKLGEKLSKFGSDPLNQSEVRPRKK